MKTLGAFAASLAGPVTTLCRLVKFTTLSAAVYALTDLDVNCTYGNVVYRADVGIDATSITVQDGSAQSSVDITMLLQTGFITREMLASGFLDGAACQIMVFDWQAIDAVLYYAGKVRHITFNDTQSATLEIASLLDPNLQIAADLYSYTCRVDLGSTECGVPIDETAEAFTVTSISDGYLFDTTLTDADNYWINGVVSFTSGANDGLAVEVSGYSNAGGAVLLCLPTTYPLAVGDQGTIYQGCNKTPSDCCDKWNNMANYRGEPTGIPKTSTTATLGTTTAPATTPDTTTAATTPTATAAEIKVLKAYAAGGILPPVNAAAQKQCFSDGFLQTVNSSTITFGGGGSGAVVTSYSITPLGLQQLRLAGYKPNAGKPSPGSNIQLPIG